MSADAGVDSLAIEAVGVCVRRGDREILSGCDLRVAAGESVAVMGRSGSGKSTLLWVLLGLLGPEAGSVRIAGALVTGRPGRVRASVRREHVGVVFQQPDLLPELSATENVALPLLLAGVGGIAARARASELLTSLGVAETTPVAALSGGEQQRVAVARALVNRPAVVFADEPTGSLDEDAAAGVVGLLEDLTREHGTALVVVTHDSRVAGAMGSVLRLESGRLVDATAPVPVV